MALVNSQSANEPARISFSVVQLKPMIISVRMASIGISDVVTPSVYLKKTL